MKNVLTLTLSAVFALVTLSGCASAPEKKCDMAAKKCDAASKKCGPAAKKCGPATGACCASKPAR